MYILREIDTCEYVVPKLHRFQEEDVAPKRHVELPNVRMFERTIQNSVSLGGFSGLVLLCRDVVLYILSSTYSEADDPSDLVSRVLNVSYICTAHVSGRESDKTAI